MRRRDLLLSLAIGTVGALLDPRRALVDSERPVWRAAQDSTPRLHGRRADMLIIDDPPGLRGEVITDAEYARWAAVASYGTVTVIPKSDAATSGKSSSA